MGLGVDGRGWAALQGLFMADNAMLFIPRAVERCPTNGRLHLAHALVSEQQWLRGTGGTDGAAPGVDRYQQAIKSPDSAPEARMRAAWFLLRTRKLDEALALLDAPGARSTDTYVQYLTDLVRGQVLR